MKSVFISKVIFYAALLPLSQSSMGQAIIGFWEVKEVKVAGKTMTPVAKWMRINRDGSFQSGNGWLQNSEGTWKFDKVNNTYLPTETNGILEDYGAFKVSVEGVRMSWERVEDGDQVIVKLERIEKLPKSTADLLVGLWDLTERLKNGISEKSLHDPGDKYYIFIRWDRIYVERLENGDKSFSYWHINGHKPELTVINQKDPKQMETWSVEVDNKTLKMSGISAQNAGLQLIFERINKFPN